MKFKVGDKVKVAHRVDTRPGWVSDMDEWLGKTITIDRVFPESKTYIVKENGWKWCDEMLEPAEEEPAMKEFYFLVFCKHSRNGKTFLFSLDQVKICTMGTRYL